MAHRIDQSKTAHGAAVYANEPAWHGLGVTLDHAPTAEEAIVKAGLDWQVELRPLMVPTSGGPREIPATFATVRTDTESALGIVSGSYRPLQNSEAFDALSIVLEEAGLFYESAGALDDGQRIWLLARHPDKFTAGGDAVDRFVLLHNGHDGQTPVTITPAGIRVVCHNTLIMVMRRADAARQGVKLAHRANLADRLADARSAFARVGDRFKSFKREADQLARVKLTDAKADGVIEQTLDYVIGPVEMDGASVLSAAIEQTTKLTPAQKRLAKRSDARDVISTVLRRELKDAGEKLVNGWLLSQALGEWVDGSRRFQGDDTARAESRFDSLLYGDAADARAFVFETILATAN